MNSTNNQDDILRSSQLINEIRKEKPSRSKLEKVKKYLKDGANINATDANDDGNTPLHIAVQLKDYDLVEYLIANGAKVDIKNIKGETAFNAALNVAFAQQIKCLFDNCLSSSSQLDHNAKPKSPKPSIAKSTVKNEATQDQEASKNKGNNRTYTNTGQRAGKMGLHGEIYQLKLLILFLKRGLDTGYNFRLTTEMEQAKKFDDLVFEVTKNEVKEYRLLQAKHKSDSSLKITWDSLLTESDGDFSLIKYFFSFHELKKEKIFKGKLITDVTVCTNIDFDYNCYLKIDEYTSLKLENILCKLTNHDDILDSETSRSRYRFSKDINVALKDRLQDYNLTKLAKRLTTCLLQNKAIKHHDSNDIFHSYHLALANNVIDVKNKKFFAHFITGEKLDITTEKFRFVCDAEIRKQTEEKLNLSLINSAIDDNLNEVKPLNLSKNFGGGVFIEWPNNIISEDAIDDFLEHLVFAVNQPNEKELGNIIKMEIGKEYDFGNDTVYNKVFMKILEFVKNGGEEFISNETGKTFFDVVFGSIWFDVKDPVWNFIGRENELRKLKKFVIEDSNSNVTCIKGIGGIGKSELVRKFVHDNKRDFDYNVIWINAKNNKTIFDSFSRLAQDLLKITIQTDEGCNKDRESLILEVFKHISKNRKCLFVIDNQQDDEIIKFLKNTALVSDKLYFIITSRNLNWESESKVLSINAFSPAESITFIKKSLGIETVSQNAQVEKLASDLQNFPLALQQAIAYIIEKKREAKNLDTEFWIENYLKKFSEIKEDLLSFDFPEDDANPFTKTTFIVWQLTINSVKMLEHGRNAVKVLRFMAFLSADNIPIDIFSGIVDSENELKLIIALLEQFSMVYIDKDHAVINVNRLVQYVKRLKLRGSKDEVKIILQALELLKNYVSHSESVNTNYLAVHINCIWSFGKMYEDVVKKLKQLPSEMIDAINKNFISKNTILFVRQMLAAIKNEIDPTSDYSSEILESLALAYYKIGDRAEALSNYEIVFSKQKAQLGRFHENTLRTQQIIISILIAQNKLNEAHSTCLELCHFYIINLGRSDLNTIETQNKIAFILHKQCKYEESLDLYKTLLKTQTNLLGSNHSITLETELNLASVLKSQCKYQEALNLYHEVYNKCKSLFGTINQTTLKTLIKIARLYVLLQDFPEALRIYKNVLEKRQSIFGLHNVETFNVHQDIAFIYIYQSNYNKAVLKFDEIIIRQEQVLGRTHENLLKSLSGIALAHEMSGNYLQALVKYEFILNIQSSGLGIDHRDTLRTSFKIAQIYFYQNNYVEALAKLKAVLQMQTNSLGKTHKDTFQTLNTIAAVYQLQGENTQALIAYNDLLQKQQVVLGSYHKDTLNSLYGIAFVYISQGNYKTALKELDQVLCERNKLLGPNHTDTLKTLNAIAIIYENQFKYTEALIQLKTLLQKQENILGNNHKYYLKTLFKIGTIYLKQTNFEKALLIYKQLLKQQIEIFGFNSKGTLKTVYGVATVYLKKNSFPEALAKYEALLNVQTQVLGPFHRDTLETSHGVAAVYLKQGDYQEALLKYETLLEVRSQNLGPAHKDTLKTLQVIARIYHHQQNYKEALLKHEIISKIYSRVFGPTHFKTLESLTTIADVNFTLGNFGEALSKYKELLKKQETVLGDKNHKNILQTLGKIGNIFFKQSNYAEAFLMYEDLLGRQVCIPKQKQSIFKTMRIIGDIYVNQGNYSTALLKYEELLSKQENVLGALETLNKIADVHRLLENYTDAVITYEDLLNKLETSSDSNSKIIKKIKKEIFKLKAATVHLAMDGP